MIKVDYLVVGAGVAGVSAALAIRKTDPEGSIIIVNGEAALPYKRTKLSKALVSGYHNDSFTLYPLSHYRQQRIELVHDWLTAHNWSQRRLDGRQAYHYRKLVLACGANCQIPGSWQSERSLCLHSIADGLELQRQAQLARSIAVLGAGVEGLELASAYAASHRVVLIELAAQPLSTVASNYIQRQLRQSFARTGLSFYSHETIENLVLREGVLQLDCLKRQLTVDLLLLATGIKVDMPLLFQQPGAVMGQVDQYLRWSTDVYLAGDLCCYQGQRCLLWHEAESLGIGAGRNAALDLLGRTLESYKPRLYRTKLECFGLFLFLAQPRVLSGQAREYLRDDRYYQLWFNGRRLAGANMSGDKMRAGLLQQLIWQQAPLEQVEEQLQLIGHCTTALE